MRDEITYLYDILDAARRAVKYAQSVTFEEFLSDDELQAALLWRFTIIGEAAKKISIVTRQSLPGLPFNLMAGLRDKIVHVYWRTNLQIIWKTTTQDLPKLVESLTQRLGPIDAPPEVIASLSYARGKFIVLDGNEGCGKSTQSEMLRAALASAGLDVLAARDPGSTRIGEQVRAVLLNPDHGEMGMRCEMLLYMAARAQMAAEMILPALGAGKTVVCDRFVSSTLAYQLGGDGLTAGEIRATADVAIRGRWPDLTILLDMPAGQSMARVKRAKDRIEQRPAEYHERVRQNFLVQAKADPLRYRLIPADRSREEVHADIMRAVASLATTASPPHSIIL